MGYSTEYNGTLFFKNDITLKQLRGLQKLLSVELEDTLVFPNIRSIDLVVNDEFTGLVWNGSEKSYFMDQQIQLLFALISYHKLGNISIEGVFTCQGEDPSDRYYIKVFEHGNVYKEEIKRTGNWVSCPHCSEEFEVKNELE